jgi:hypothetical protein
LTTDAPQDQKDAVAASSAAVAERDKLLAVHAYGDASCPTRRRARRSY